MFLHGQFGATAPRTSARTAVDLRITAAAERDRELIADLAAERSVLGEAQMVDLTGCGRKSDRPAWTCSRLPARRGSGWANSLLSMAALVLDGTLRRRF